MNFIIPNWHPLFVHFTVALVMFSALVHISHLMVTKESLLIKTATVANWNLWAGAIVSLITVLAGWFAYNSVAHDTPSHEAMTVHRNWALATATSIIAVASWSYWHSRTAIRLSKGIVVATVLVAGLVGATGWLGGEVVYRYGLGVMSLPKTDTHSHAAGTAAHDDGGASEKSPAEGAHSHADENSKHDSAPADHDTTPHEHNDGENDTRHDSMDGAMGGDSTKKPHDDGHDHTD